MSDFGAVLTAFKRDDSSFSASQLSELSKKLKKIILKRELINSIEEEYNYHFERLDEEPHAFVRISEYYFDGDEEIDAEALAETKELESEDVAIMIKKLSKHFPK
jgi:hypothetical protein